MRHTRLLAACAAVTVAIGLAADVRRDDRNRLGTVHARDAARSAPDATPPKGPHGGRLLADGDFALEVTIFERGVPPEFRVYASQAGAPVDPADVSARIELRRLGGRLDVFLFTPVGDYLRGNGVVEEPHSFDVTVTAGHGGTTHHWTYASYEGRVVLTPEAVEASGLVLDSVGPATVRTRRRLYGRVVPDADRQAHVAARYSGIVTHAHKRLGDVVAAGEVLAVVQSSDSLQSYEVRAPLGGTVTAKDVTPGELAAEGAVIYEITDLGSVWVDLHARRDDLPHLRVGQPVTIHAGDGSAPATATLGYVSPLGDARTQTLLARVALPNSTGRWHPGWLVSAEVVVEEVAVPLAVKTTALQTFRDWDVVFVNVGDVFEVRPLVLGRRDADWVEVRSGLMPGQRYVAQNSFIIKADIGKSGATHDH